MATSSFQGCLLQKNRFKKDFDFLLLLLLLFGLKQRCASWPFPIHFRFSIFLLLLLTILPPSSLTRSMISTSNESSQNEEYRSAVIGHSSTCSRCSNCCQSSGRGYPVITRLPFISNRHSSEWKEQVVSATNVNRDHESVIPLINSLHGNVISSAQKLKIGAKIDCPALIMDLIMKSW